MLQKSISKKRSLLTPKPSTSYTEGMKTAFPDLCNFLDSVPTPWHTTKELSSLLKKHGYIELDLATRFTLAPGKKIFVKKGGALFTFSLPKKKIEKLFVFTTHTDSPSYMVKRNPDATCHDMNSLLIEPYGAPLQHTWLDRDLFLAGRAYTSKGKKLHEHTLSLKNHLFTIPSLAIHLDREQKMPQNKQTHLRPLFSLGKNATLESLLQSQLSGEKIHSFELLLIPYEPARILHSNLISSYRLDNIASVHATVDGLLTAKKQPENTLVCHAMFNHEEIGSGTDEGGLSALFTDILTRISFALYDSALPYHEWKANGLGVSIDMAHALHPNYQEKYDEQNTPQLGEGVAIKYHACKKYATSAYSASYIEHIAAQHKIPLQHFTAHSDATSGSTIGRFLSHELGIEVVDIGIPQLAMHSSRELISEKDYKALSKLVRNLI